MSRASVLGHYIRDGDAYDRFFNQLSPNAGAVSRGERNISVS